MSPYRVEVIRKAATLMDVQRPFLLTTGSVNKALTQPTVSATTETATGAETNTGQKGETAPDATAATSLAAEQMPAEGETSPKTRGRPSFFVHPRPVTERAVRKGGASARFDPAGGRYA